MEGPSDLRNLSSPSDGTIPQTRVGLGDGPRRSRVDGLSGFSDRYPRWRPIVPIVTRVTGSVYLLFLANDGGLIKDHGPSFPKTEYFTYFKSSLIGPTLKVGARFL